MMNLTKEPGDFDALELAPTGYDPEAQMPQAKYQGQWDK